MTYTYSDYTYRSQRLANAAQQLLDSLDDPYMDRSLAISDIEHAAAGAVANLAKGFEATTGTARISVRESPEDVLSGALLELYSANVLMSAGVAVNEHGGGAHRTFLSESVQQLEASSIPIVASLAFEADTNVQSASLDAARQTFRSNAAGVLGDVVDEAAAVITDIVNQMKKLDAAKVLEAVETLGAAVPIVASGGRLIRQGLEKLKNVLNALGNLVGPELFAKVKDKVLEVWKKAISGDFTRSMVGVLVQQTEMEQRIAAAVNRHGVALENYDRASNDIASLSKNYAAIMKLLRSLLNAVVTAGAILILLPIAVPSLPAVTAGAYAVLVAVVVVTAMSYSGSADWLRRDPSIGELADALT